MTCLECIPLSGTWLFPTYTTLLKRPRKVLQKDMEVPLTKERRTASRKAEITAASHGGLSERPQYLIISFPVGYKPEAEAALNWKDKKYPNYVQESSKAGHPVLLLRLSLHVYPLKNETGKNQALKIYPRLIYSLNRHLMSPADGFPGKLPDLSFRGCQMGLFQSLLPNLIFGILSFHSKTSSLGPQKPEAAQNLGLPRR